MADRTAGLLARFAGAGRWRRLFALWLAGGLSALGQPPFGLFWVALPALGFVFLAALFAPRPRVAVLYGWLAGFGWALVSMAWIVEPFLVDVARDGWMAPFALFFMAAGFGAFWASGFGLARLIGPPGSMALALALPVMLTASEVARSYLFSGFPWGLTAFLWIDTPIYQYAAFMGPHGLSLLSLLLAMALALAVLQRRVAGLVGLLVLGLAAWLGGDLLENRLSQTPPGPRPLVRLIQPDAEQDKKWDPQMIPVFYNRQLAFSAAPAVRRPDLIVWPEVAVPFLLNDPQASLWEIAGAGAGAPVVLGGQRLENGRAYNSLAVLDARGEITARYDKHHLVPFGEYLPGRTILARLGLKAMAARLGDGYESGPGPQVLDLGVLGKAEPLICYEAIFAQEIRQAPERPDWLLMLTNDAWFGKAMGPYQHFAQARARAIEFALPMVRVANTGISAVIDGRGRVVASLPLGKAGYLDALLPAPLAPSLYWQFGDIPVFGALIVLALAAFWLRRRISD